ncbi:metal ABC transporter solute-binding protein, Zn/Mn family [Methanococcoides sp.]|uniref:metal ABC transporter solute-binding protein, Zn/Mn family n=1 Tax=Methanococcoides sp. TaxID=1966350 RepID=UPI00272E4E69|nr:zinc ABC transporter substrate-binding protein [Methanococcoides sp.]
MNNKILPVIVLLIVAFSGNACINGVPDQQNGPKQLIIVTSILPQADFIEHIGGDKVEVIVMIPPGANPATYEPTASQLKAVSSAGMYAKVGSGLLFEEVWLDKIISTNPDMLMVDTSKGVTLMEMEEHHHEEENSRHNNDERSMDPHIWLSPENAQIMVQNICDGLIRIDPANETYYEQNKEQYIRDLEVLDSKINQSLSGFKNRTFMVFHPSWGYFARDYNLTMIAVEIEGKEPSVSDMAHLIKTAKENDINVIFVQPQFSTKSAEVIAKEIGGGVIPADSLAKDYLVNLHEVTNSFAQSLT